MRLGLLLAVMLGATSARKAMKPLVAAAAWTTGVLIDISIKRSPSSRRHNSAVIFHGQAGSSNFQRCAFSGPSIASDE